MKATNYFFPLCFVILFSVAESTPVFAQNLKKQEDTDIKKNVDDVVMTWNKNTPESEMNDDVKALKKQGVTINYSDVKRNAKNEITGLKVSYEDEKGNKGELKISHQLPIQTITFYKMGDQIGFGEPSYSNALGDFFNNGNGLKQFGFRDKEDPSGDSFGYNFSDKDTHPKSSAKSKMVIINPHKKMLIIEDGKIKSGGEDYTAEEIEKIKKENEFNTHEWGDSKFKNQFGELDLRTEEGAQEFAKKIQKMIPSDVWGNNQKSEWAAAKEEMIKAKEELEKARLALEKATQSALKKK